MVVKAMSERWPEYILEFQAGREAAIENRKRDGRKHRDWLAGYDQVKPMRETEHGK